MDSGEIVLMCVGGALCAGLLLALVLRLRPIARARQRARRRRDDNCMAARRAVARAAVRHRRRTETRLELDEFGRQKCRPPDGAGGTNNGGDYERRDTAGADTRGVRAD